MWPGSFCRTLAWIAGSHLGITYGDGGIWLAMPDTVEMVTVSPLSTVSSGLSAASKKPQCTVSGAHRADGSPCSSQSHFRNRALPFLKDEESASRNQREATR